MEKKNLGYMTIEKTRTDFMPTHYLYLLIDNKLKVGELYTGDWKYEYSLRERGIEISEINEVKKVPKELSTLKVAIEEVDFPTKLMQYKLTIYSSLKNKEIEVEVFRWLKEEKGEDTKIITHIIHIPKVTRKKIPLTVDNLAKAIKRGAKIEYKEVSSHSSTH